MAEESIHQEVAHEANAHAVFPPFQSETFASQILWLVLTFGVLYWLMSKVALPRIADALAGRRQSIAGQLDAAAAMQAKAKEASDAHDKTIADARANAQATAQKARDALSADADSKRKTLEAELSARLAAAEAQIAETTARAMANVDQIATDAAHAIIERLTGKPVAADVVAQAVANAKQG
jgi:F-type H+-transporting ATPase subunit b